MHVYLVWPVNSVIFRGTTVRYLRTVRRAPGRPSPWRGTDPCPSSRREILYVAYVVVVYHVTIVAIGHGLLKKFWPLVLGCVLYPKSFR